jgi:hypothetical protein
MTRLSIALMIALAVLASPIGAPAQQPRSGGVFRIGIPDPPALDPHQVVNFLQTVAASPTAICCASRPARSSRPTFGSCGSHRKMGYQNPTTLVFSLRRAYGSIRSRR